MPEFRRIPVIRVLVVALAFSSGALAQDAAPPAQDRCAVHQTLRRR